jgi:hypothetical protein
MPRFQLALLLKTHIQVFPFGRRGMLFGVYPGKIRIHTLFLFILGLKSGV